MAAIAGRMGMSAAHPSNAAQQTESLAIGKRALKVEDPMRKPAKVVVATGVKDTRGNRECQITQKLFFWATKNGRYCCNVDLRSTSASSRGRTTRLPANPP